MKPMISILIPCYKVERYIRQCLDSIFAISLLKSEYEVLCFDDQSPDNTLDILHEYALLHPNMRVIHSGANVGREGERNRLFAIAKGEYIWFVNGDDLNTDNPNLFQPMSDEETAHNRQVVEGYLGQKVIKERVAKIVSLLDK